MKLLALYVICVVAICTLFPELALMGLIMYIWGVFIIMCSVELVRVINGKAK